MRWLDRRGLGRELLPRVVVDAVAHDAVIGRRVVQDLELRDALAGGAIGARLDPQLRALAAARDANAVDPERFLIAARAADRGLPVAGAPVAHVALIVVPRRWLA